MQAESVDINALVFDPSNARLHSNKNLDAIKGSLTKFGQQTPIVIDENGIVLKGNGTLAAAKGLGWQRIWVIRASLNSVQKAAYSIADNRASELATWDGDVLAKTILSLRDEDFGLGEIGFDDLDIDKILGEGFKPDLPDEGEKPQDAASSYQLRVDLESEDKQQELFEELRDRGYKVKV